MLKRPAKGIALSEEDYPKIRFPCAGFPKIDGFRCLLGSFPMTSSLNRFPNHAFHNSLSGLLPADCLLDGEVVVGRKRGSGVLQRASSGITSEDGNPDYTVWVFDSYHRGYSFTERYDLAGQVVKQLGHPQIRMLKYRVLYDLNEFLLYLAECLAKGYEGIITRSLDGPYKEGKSTFREQYMLKVKPFTDFEARIKGYFEEEENTNEAKREKTGKLKRSSAKAGKKKKGTLGGFIGQVLDSRGKETNVTVRVGGGFTARQRKDLFAIADELVEAGAVMECVKQLVGELNKPRHPNFKRIRPGWDLDHG